MLYFYPSFEFDRMVYHTAIILYRSVILNNNKVHIIKNNMLRSTIITIKIGGYITFMVKFHASPYNIMHVGTENIRQLPKYRANTTGIT